MTGDNFLHHPYSGVPKSIIEDHVWFEDWWVVAS
jgi:hypothetical protein